jgi:site-specific DNA-cytosine methylase
VDDASGFVQRGREEGARLEAFGEVTPSLRDASRGGGSQVFVKVHHAEDDEDGETWEESSSIVPTIDTGNLPTTLIATSSRAEDPLLPKGIDSHRYRCCGNGVVAPVATWIGQRLADWALEEGR